eukprot:972516-Amphidinium_carterae.2
MQKMPAAQHVPTSSPAPSVMETPSHKWHSAKELRGCGKCWVARQDELLHSRWCTNHVTPARSKSAVLYGGCDRRTCGAKLS